MKTIMQWTIATAITLVLAQAAAGQVTITGPSSVTSGQPTTVTWSGSLTPACTSGVKVGLSLGSVSVPVTTPGNRVIQEGSPAQVAAGRVTIPAMSLTGGSQVTLSLVSMCTGNVIATGRTVSVTGAAAAAPAVPVGITITPQITANIDSACISVLGAACSTTASNSSTYTAITQQIKAGGLKSDTGSISANYLIPMVRSSVAWQAAIVDGAWRSAGCTGAAPESQWEPKVVQLQTYQAVVAGMRQQGCGAAAANVALAPAVQYQTRAQLAPAYSQVWGAAAGNATFVTNCPTTVATLTCVRQDLGLYVRQHPTILQTIESPAYVLVTGQPMTNAQGQILSNAYGAGWTGADDLKTYIQANAVALAPVRIFGGLSPEGCLIDSIRIKLDVNEPCGMYFLSSTGAHSAGAYQVAFQGARFTLSPSSAGGVLVSNTGLLLRVVTTGSKWAIGNNIVAQGGGNIVAQGGGNIVAQGGGNIVAQGGGNIVAQGGGNIVAQGGGNLIEDGAAYMKMLVFTDAATAARLSGLVTSGGASIISQDGNGFQTAIMNQLPAIAGIMGGSSSGVGVLGGAAAIATKPGVGVVGDNGGGIGTINPNSLMTDNGAAYTAQSVNGAKAAVITAPSTWTYGQSAMIKWTQTPGAVACAKGYMVLINGTNAVGNASALSLGMSLLPANTWPRGTISVSLKNMCTLAPDANPFTVQIQ